MYLKTNVKSFEYFSILKNFKLTYYEKNKFISIDFCDQFSFFAQEKGQWSFGAGGDFTAPDANANIGYFATDGLLLSFDFEMGMDYKEEHIHEDGETHKERVEGDFTWGGSLRYYAKDNMFVEGGLKMGDGYDDPDLLSWRCFIKAWL